jgi:hypothetical protein
MSKLSIKGNINNLIRIQTAPGSIPPETISTILDSIVDEMLNEITTDMVTEVLENATLTGPLSLFANPSSAMHAATKQYSDNPANIIQSASYRFVNDTEKTLWNGAVKFKGKYTSLANLESAHPTGNDGEYAIVDPGIGTDAVEYIWDADEGWLLASGGGTSYTPGDGMALAGSSFSVNDTVLRTAGNTSGNPITGDLYFYRADTLNSFINFKNDNSPDLISYIEVNAGFFNIVSRDEVTALAPTSTLSVHHDKISLEILDLNVGRNGKLELQAYNEATYGHDLYYAGGNMYFAEGHNIEQGIYAGSAQGSPREVGAQFLIFSGEGIQIGYSWPCINVRNTSFGVSFNSYPEANDPDFKIDGGAVTSKIPLNLLSSFTMAASTLWGFNGATAAASPSGWVVGAKTVDDVVQFLLDKGMVTA